MSYTIRKETQLTNENAENRGLYSNPKTGTFLVVLAAITQQGLFLLFKLQFI